ncbi:hypothetical protein ACNA06_20830 [Lysinibacillus sp. RSDA_15]|uniref:hypothetical protein n=1 Tax=Lysinibacillus sp. RSDA_15 TaxID=3391421 RepID=UPI003A4D3554
MRRLQIGMWNGLDEKLWNNNSIKEVTGIEVSQNKDENHLQELSNFCKDMNLSFGIHTPVIKNNNYPRFTSISNLDLKKSLEIAEKEVILASRYNAEYILFHFPYPPIMPSNVDVSQLKKLQSFEFYTSSFVEDFYQKGSYIFEKLCNIQRKYNQKIVLEYDFFGDYSDEYNKLFFKHKELSLVVDVQRLAIHHKLHPSFDPYQWLDDISPSVYLVHYSNIYFGKESFEEHIPVLTSQNVDNNFGDALNYIKFLNERNKKFHLTFEHRSDYVTKVELLDCYQTIIDLFNN